MTWPYRRARISERLYLWGGDGVEVVAEDLEVAQRRVASVLMMKYCGLEPEEE